MTTIRAVSGKLRPTFGVGAVVRSLTAARALCEAVVVLSAAVSPSTSWRLRACPRCGGDLDDALNLSLVPEFGGIDEVLFDCPKKGASL